MILDNADVWYLEYGDVYWEFLNNKTTFMFVFSKKFRDGPFDIQGGGWDFSSRQVFFSLFLQNKLFFQK